MSVNSQSYPPPFNQGDREHRRVREAEEKGKTKSSWIKVLFYREKIMFHERRPENIQKYRPGSPCLVRVLMCGWVQMPASGVDRNLQLRTPPIAASIPYSFHDNTIMTPPPPPQPHLFCWARHWSGPGFCSLCTVHIYTNLPRTCGSCFYLEHSCMSA